MSSLIKNLINIVKRNNGVIIKNTNNINILKKSLNDYKIEIDGFIISPNMIIYKGKYLQDIFKNVLLYDNIKFVNSNLIITDVTYILKYARCLTTFYRNKNGYCCKYENSENVSFNICNLNIDNLYNFFKYTQFLLFRNNNNYSILSILFCYINKDLFLKLFNIFEYLNSKYDKINIRCYYDPTEIEIYSNDASFSIEIKTDDILLLYNNYNLLNKLIENAKALNKI